MFEKSLIEILLYILQEIVFRLTTRLPYPWDFCRIKIDLSTRLLFNSGSYFIVYATFMAWFVTYSIKTLNRVSEGRHNSRHIVLVIISSVAAVTLILWPLLLISAHLFARSYYPWFTALIVAILWIPFPPPNIFTFTQIYSRTDIDTRFLSCRLSLDGIRTLKRQPKTTTSDSSLVFPRDSIKDFEQQANSIVSYSSPQRSVSIEYASEETIPLPPSKSSSAGIVKYPSFDFQEKFNELKTDSSDRARISETGSECFSSYSSAATRARMSEIDRKSFPSYLSASTRAQMSETGRQDFPSYSSTSIRPRISETGSEDFSSYSSTATTARISEADRESLPSYSSSSTRARISETVKQDIPSYSSTATAARISETVKQDIPSYSSTSTISNQNTSDERMPPVLMERKSKEDSVEKTVTHLLKEHSFETD